MISVRFWLLFLICCFFNFSIDVQAAEGYPDAPSRIAIDNLFQFPEHSWKNNIYIEQNHLVVTDSTHNSIGFAYSKEENKLNLTQDFSIETYIYMKGYSEGLAFVMHNDPDKIKKHLRAVNGEHLGIYYAAYSIDFMNQAPQNSFAIEFDTFLNTKGTLEGDTWADGPFDYFVDKSKDGGKGHIAYTFPALRSSYYINSLTINTKALYHKSLQYPDSKLTDGKWRLFKINWSAAQRLLTYQLEGLSSVSVVLPYSTFNSNSVYWGFSGSNGNRYTHYTDDRIIVAFKSMNGISTPPVSAEKFSTYLIAVDKNNTLITGKVPNNSEVSYVYSGIYEGNKDSVNPNFTFELDKKQEYVPGTFKIDNPAIQGERDKEGYVSINPILSIDGHSLLMPSWMLPKIGYKNPETRIKFNVRDVGVDADTKLTVKSSMTSGEMGSQLSYSYNVQVDKEAPTGVGKLIFMTQNDISDMLDSTKYSDYFMNYEDNFSSKENIKITLTPGQELEQLVGSVGPNSFKLRLTDERNNSRDIAIPIFVENDELVRDSQYILYGTSFEVQAVDYPLTSQDLEGLIKNQFKLWKYGEQTIEELDSNILFIATDGLPAPGKTPQAGIYHVTAKYEGIEKMIELEIISSLKEVTISFVDEQGNSILSDLVFEANVGDKIDLSQQDKIKENLKEAQKMNYLLAEVPEDEKECLILPEGVSRTYIFKGGLKIYSVPKNIDFGTYSVADNNIFVNNPTYDHSLVVWDNRVDLKPWKMMLKEQASFNLINNHDFDLPNILSYYSQQEEIIINNEVREIFSMTHQKQGKYDISKNNWGPDKDGLRLRIPKGAIKLIGEYKTTLTWQLEESY